MCSQDFSTNELEIDFLFDLVIFQYFFVDPEPCRPGDKLFFIITHFCKEDGFLAKRSGHEETKSCD